MFIDLLYKTNGDIFNDNNARNTIFKPSHQTETVKGLDIKWSQHNKFYSITKEAPLTVTKGPPQLKVPYETR